MVLPLAEKMVVERVAWKAAMKADTWVDLKVVPMVDYLEEKKVELKVQW